LVGWENRTPFAKAGRSPRLIDEGPCLLAKGKTPARRLACQGLRLPQLVGSLDPGGVGVSGDAARIRLSIQS
jgi:hypothetical protein